jgi:hypothetical protein
MVVVTPVTTTITTFWHDIDAGARADRHQRMEGQLVMEDSAERNSPPNAMTMTTPAAEMTWPVSADFSQFYYRATSVNRT